MTPKTSISAGTEKGVSPERSLLERFRQRLQVLLLGKRTKTHKFGIGETVKVKDRENISVLIQPTRRLDGCLFMEQMWDYCGKTYAVSKVVDSFHNELRRENFSPRASLYILEGLICDGRVNCFSFRCDHGCFILWHEDWLDKTALPDEGDDRCAN